MRAPSLSACAAALCLCAAACARPEAPTRPLAARAAALSEARLSPMVAPDAVERPDRHLLVTLRMTPAVLTVLDARQVGFGVPVDRAPEPEPWRVLVEDGQGRTLYLAQLRAPSPVRGEFARPDGTIEVAHGPRWPVTLAVRLPPLRGAATLRLFGQASTLPPEDPRAQGVGPEAMVELGKVAFPQVDP